jgi:hypothetical protein
MPDPKPMDRTATDPQRPGERQKPGPTPGPGAAPSPVDGPAASPEPEGRSSGESGGRISEP